MATTIAELQARITADTSGFKSGMQEAQGGLKGFGSGILGAAKGALDFGLKLGGSIFAVKTLTDTALGLGQALLSPAASMEQNTIAFTTLLGSGEKANAMLADLRDFANTTPFEFPQLVTASQHMLAFGFSAKDIKPMLTNIGDAMAAMGQSGESVDRVATIFGQMHAAGKVNAQDMLQLTSMGIPAWQMLADKMGLTVPQVQKLASQGLIPADKAISDLSDSFKNKFGGAMDKQSHTLNGLMSTLSDLGTTLLTNLGGPIISAIEPYISKLIEMLSSPAFADFATMVGTTLAGALSGIGGLIQQILPYFTNLSGGIGTQVLPVFQQMASFFMTTLWPAIQQIAQIFITQVLPVLMQVQQVIVTQVLPAVLQFVAPIITQLIPALLQLIATIAPVLIPVLNVLGFIVGNVLAPVFGFLITVIVTVIGWIVQIIKWLSHAGDAFSGLGKWAHDTGIKIQQFALEAAAKISGFVLSAISFFQQLPGKVTAFIATMMVNVATKIREGVGAAQTAIGSVITGILNKAGELKDKLVRLVSDAINGLINAIKNKAGDVARAFGDLFSGIHFPGFASGGVTPGGLVMVGEHGPEVVALPRGSRVYPHGTGPGSDGAGGGGNTYVTNVYPQQAVLDTAELSRIQRRQDLLRGMY